MLRKKWIPPTPREMDEKETAMLREEVGPDEPENINVARELDRFMKDFGGGALKEAEIRAETSFHEEDREDWADVARIIRERQAAMAKR